MRCIELFLYKIASGEPYALSMSSKKIAPHKFEKKISLKPLMDKS